MTVKVLWMAEDCHHNLILLFLIYLNQSPCTELLHIRNSKGSNNITYSMALVNQFLIGLISMHMILKLLKMENDGHHSHIPPLHTWKNRSPCTEHLYILRSSRSILIFLANQFWCQTLHLLLILHLVVDLSRVLLAIIQAT